MYSVCVYVSTDIGVKHWMRSLTSPILALRVTSYEAKGRHIQSVLRMTQLRIARRQVFRTRSVLVSQLKQYSVSSSIV